MTHDEAAVEINPTFLSNIEFFSKISKWFVLKLIQLWKPRGV